MKPSSRRSKWIHGTHYLELGQESYAILKMLKAAKLEVPVWKTGWSGFYGSNPNLSQDFYRIWLGFSDLWKVLCPAAYIYVGHGQL
jgi:hypothetical protein